MSTATTHIETKKQLVPELRFKEFDGDIEETLFGSHYSFHTTNSLSRDKLNYDKGEVRNIHYGDIHTKFQTHFNLANEYVPLINDDVDLAKIKEDSYCKVGDLVIADASEDYADIGKSIELIDINNEKLLAGLHTFLARPSSESTAVGYISCLLKSWKLRKQIMTIAQGTKVLSLSAGRVSNLKLNLPSLPEQQKIASFLAAVDEKIQQLTKKKALLEHYKKGVMQQLFSGQLRFKDENGKDYPDWEEKRLIDITKINQGLQIAISERFLEPVEDGYFYITNEFLRAKSEKAYYIKSPPASVICDADDILMTRTGNTGQVVTGVDGAFHNNFFKIKYQDHCEKWFLYYFLTSPLTQHTILKLAGTSTIPDLNHGDFYKIKIDLPSIEEQSKISMVVKSIDTKIESVNNQITQTQTFKKGLLQQLFV
jgi:type I restriction enzyme S subunit